MTTVVLAHGWGFDSGVWDGVRARLSPALRVGTVDLGFFGVPRTPTFGNEPVIAVGHSLGACWWLTQAPCPWRRLLMINGFARFTASDGYPGVAPRVLARMRKAFAQTPAAVLAEFRARCGAPPAPPQFDAQRLAAGLDGLAAWDGCARLAERAADIWALAGSNDPVVPPAMARIAFAGLAAEHLVFDDAPGHVLPLANPALCAAWIAQLANAPAAP